MDAPSIEFLVFQLGKEEYAIDILKIQEIRQYEGVIPIANSPKFIPGVITINDAVIPLIDMRRMFNLENNENNKLTMAIILNLSLNRVIGIIVDSVYDVIKLEPLQIKSTPEFVTTIHNEYIQGIAMFDGRALIILDIEKILSVVELNALYESISNKK